MSILDRFRSTPALRPEVVDEIRQQVAEQRAPTAATQPLRYQGVGNAQVPEWGAEQAVRLAYLSNVFVYACARAIAQDLAALPFRAGADPDRPNDWNPRARLAQLLGPTPGGPAPKLSARRLWAWSITQRLVTGRFGWEIELAGAEVAALWPLVSANLDAIPSEGGSEWFTGFRYGRPDRKRRLPADRVFYSWNPSQADFRQPESALQAARLDVSVAVMQDRYDHAFLKNDARPAAIVVTEEFARREEFDAFRSQWRGEYAGPDNAGKTAFLEASGGDNGVKNSVLIQTLGLSQKDAEFMARYESKLRGICVAMGVPMSRLMDASKRTFSNADRETTNYWQNTLLPLAVDLQDDVNMSLAPRLGSEVGWFDVSGVEALRPPKRYQEVGLPALVQGGILTQNEARSELGKPAIEGGDSLLDPLAAEQTSPESAPPPPVALAAAAPAPEQRHQPPAMTAEEIELVSEQRRARIWRSTDSQVRSLERAWERRWRAEFRRQERNTLDRLLGKRGRQLMRQATEGEQREAFDPTSVFDPQFWEQEANELAQGLFEAVFAVGGARVSDLFGVAFDLDSPTATQFVEARANQLAGQVTSTTYDAIKAQMSEGVAAGEGIDEIAARIRSVFDTASDLRARTIARTEVVSAYNGSAMAVATSLPVDVVAGHEWIATRDARTREAHGSADGQAVPVGSGFSVGGELLAYPGDPNGSADNTVNCRCTVAFLTPAELAERRARPSSVVPLDRFQRAAARVATGSRSVEQAMIEVAS